MYLLLVCLLMTGCYRGLYFLGFVFCSQGYVYVVEVKNVIDYTWIVLFIKEVEIVLFQKC